MLFYYESKNEGNQLEVILFAILKVRRIGNATGAVKLLDTLPVALFPSNTAKEESLV